MKTLFPPQKISHDALVTALQAHGAALDSSDTGTGKTMKAVEVARSLGRATFVVCPKAVIPAWRSTFAEQGVPVIDVLNYEKLRTGNTPYVSKAGKNFTWSLPQDSLLIFDEVHKAKSPKSQNSKLLVTARRHGLMTLMLSATAAEDPRELWAIGFALGLHRLHDFWQWAQRFGVVFDQFGGAQFPEKNRPRLAQLNSLIYPARGHKLTRADMGVHFKKTQIVTDGLDFGGGQKLQKLCEELERELEVLEERREGDGEQPIALTKILRLRQQIELMKVPTIVDLIKDEIDQGRSVAVFLNFNDSIDALSRRLGIPHAFIRGGQSDADRQTAIEDFQADRKRVVLANIAAGGVGVSLHDTHGRHPRIAFISPTYNAKDLAQTLGRVDRVGAETDSVQRILVAAGTFEEEVMKKIVQKTENLAVLHQQPVLNTSPQMTDSLATATPATPLASSEEGPKHAKFGPSSLKMFAKCPGYQNREGETNEAAEMGTRIHEALETGDWSKLSDFEHMVAQQCWNGLDFIIRRHGMEKAIVHNEIRLNIDLGGGLSTFGTSDVLMRLGKVGVKVDYKTGVGAIDAVDQNYQAKAYTVGAFQKFPELETLDFYFVIPRRDEILHHQFKRSEVGGLREELRNVILAAEETRKAIAKYEEGQVPPELIHSLLNPTDKVCNYCARAGSCTALRHKALQVAASYSHDDFEIPDFVHGSEIDSPEELSRMLKLVPILEKWASGIRQRADAMVFEEGKELPDFEIASRQGVRKITSALAAYGSVKDDIPIEDFLDQLDGIPVGKFESLIMDRTPRGQKKKKVEAVMKELFSVGAVTRGDDVQYLKAKK